MRVFYVTRRKMWIAGGVVAFVILLLCAVVMYNNTRSIETANLRDAVYQGNTGTKAVAITVNVDWGEEYIPAMLEQFKKYDARVTFFVTGKWAEKNTELLRSMAKAGHSVQNHGYQHAHFNTLSAAQAAEQITGAEKIIEKCTGKKSRYFAPPYGEQNRQLLQVAADLNYYLIMWSVDTIDWQRPSPEVIIKRVMNKVHNDAIILMHPTEPTVKALPDLLAALKQEGYKMLGIDEMVPGKARES